MDNNIFLCKAEISEILYVFRNRVHFIEDTLSDSSLIRKERVYLETRLDFLKSIVCKFKEAYETAD